MVSPATRLRDYGRLIRAEIPTQVVPSLETPWRELTNIAGSSQDRQTVLNAFAYHNYTSGNYPQALEQFQTAFQDNQSLQSLSNALIVARLAKDSVSMQSLAQTAVELSKSLPDSQEKAALFDALCHNCGHVNDLEGAKKHGTQALVIKDRLNVEGIQLKQRARPKFDFYQPQKNIIAFSLFGADSRYWRVAIQNAKAVSYVYPGWTCRFYIDQTVPQEALQAIADEGAQLVMNQQAHDPKTNSGLFWRFAAASDTQLDYFMCRDVDSLINVREKVAVDEWLDSDCNFHVLRDYYSHSELMLAGLWGGVAGLIGDISAEVVQYQSQLPAQARSVRNIDQLFLAHRIWPAIKGSLMQHDSVFALPGAVDFPQVGKMQPIRHVGQNMGIFLNG